MYGDMPARVRIEMHGRVALIAHPLDTACVVKRWVTDTAPSQAPVVVIPFKRWERLESRIPRQLREPNAPKYPALWLELAEALLVKYPEDASAARSARYLLSLAKGERARGSLPDLMWHASQKNHGEIEAIANTLYEPIILDEMWPAARLAVVLAP